MLFWRIIVLASISSFIYLLWYSFMISPVWLMISFVYYKIFVGLIGNQIAQHRYFSHRSFTTSKNKKYILYFASLLTGVNPVDYAVVHRHHHNHSDTVKDLHSWKNSIWDIFFPITAKSSFTGDIKISSVLDKDLRILNKWYKHILIITILVLYIVEWKLVVFLLLAGITWNYLHMIILRVWLVHVKLPCSYRNYKTDDSSYNNKFIQLIDIGEGLHNNHHKFPSKYNQAMRSGEIDPAGILIDWLFISK